MTRNYQAETAASIAALGQRILDQRLMSMNLCREIMLPGYPKTTASLNRLMPKYQFSRAKWYEVNYDWKHQVEVIEWCTQQFGPHDNQPDAWSRWIHQYTDRIQFRDERDYIWFILRWGGC